ncbi:alveolar macrophage chemotactic factor-like [Ahaetulla prasina]|uniref:alveolar macrophage chemotactic factor-like n=1 Tax=Ahaetulla prasina TaxID=499056 RepID=UPI002648B45A|nr:alveolar macrophage chemotactic factor-like [Ahaetulla prasina]
MSNRVFLGFSVLLIACHLTSATIFDPLNLSCKCVRVTSTFIRPAKYARVELFPAGVACKKMEIIITLKNKQKVCVDPGAKWVNNLLNMIENVNGRQRFP